MELTAQEHLASSHCAASVRAVFWTTWQVRDQCTLLFFFSFFPVHEYYDLSPQIYTMQLV